MIGIRLMGGLGNLLFQIATGETWRKNGYDVVYTNMDENLDYIIKNYSFRRHAEDYRDLFPNFNWDAHKCPPSVTLKPKKVPFVFVDIVPQDGIEYVGYFQSEKNFPDRGFVRFLFEPSDKIRERLHWDYSEITCSIHVRRQDYIGLQDYHTLLGIDYYEWGIDIMRKYRDVTKFFVFSDDIGWCRDNFDGDDFVFMDSVEYVAIYQMASCNNHIIANSSLSWWGAWLWEHAEKKIIAPQNWFGIKGEDPKDIIPERWQKL